MSAVGQKLLTGIPIPRSKIHGLGVFQQKKFPRHLINDENSHASLLNKKNIMEPLDQILKDAKIV